ncbi:hypothetical protein Goarm_023009 [Gossypium armourianum]|uniref:Uncharacterized protein n=1 Tax=Gossypium armourianum TaxID=34283 RepID=A0A7J9KDT2_9ROSI|nr:hypothetical protein [Gossypium armourianum]
MRLGLELISTNWKLKN